MERFCVTHERDRGLGCDVEMVQSDVGEWVRHDDAQAEIARLTAMRDNRVKALALADAEITRLRAELDAAKAERNSARAMAGREFGTATLTLMKIVALEADLAAAHRALANISGCGGCENCGDIASKAFARIDARRAAEAKGAT